MTVHAPSAERIDSAEVLPILLAPLAANPRWRRTVAER